MSLDTALRALQEDKRFMRHVTAWRVLPPRPARYGPWPSTLHPRVRALAEASGIARPYSHQSRGLSHALRGEDVILTTPTASGKSLVYQLATLHALLSDPLSRAIYLFPTKALARDQYRHLLPWLQAVEGERWVGVYDGDTPRAERGRIRREARILITNPDMLHRGILPYHTRWAHLWQGLRYVVVDEVHTYRGIFGGHVANVFRRLQRVAHFYGARPAWVLTSATVGNPMDLARQLVGREPHLIEEDGAPQPRRTLIFYNPPLVDPALGVRRSALLEAQRMALHFLRHEVQTVAFATSRRHVEVLLTYLREEAPRHGLDPRALRGYRGGYLPRVRREIEAGLREGRVRGVVATNALELGVDIGALGAALLVGYPGSVAATWQQFGRAGRRETGGVGVFIAGAGALDQYIVNHPEFILSGRPEHVLLAADNVYVLVDHVRCALFELPFAEGERLGTAEATGEILDHLVEWGEAHRAGKRYHWVGEGYPAADVSLRTAAADRVVIQVEEKGGLRTLGEVDALSAPRLVHPGAVYLHEGVSYLVREVDWTAGWARVTEATLDYYTQPITQEVLTVLATEAQEERRGTIRARGPVRVQTQVVGYRKVRWYTHETLGYGEVDTPPYTLETVGYWMVFRPSVLDVLREQGGWRSDPIEDYGPNWEVQRRRALERDGYRCRRCGVPDTPERPLHVHHIRPFRTFGYVPGENEAYKEANRLDNLITLCPRCHRLAETSVRLRTGFSGLAYAIAALAPLFVMAAPGDVGHIAEVQSPHTGLPTITLYDNVPGGIGLAERLYEVHDELLAAAQERVSSCECEHGCPSCVGPVLVEEEEGWDTKRLTLLLIQAVRDVERRQRLTIDD